MTFKPLLVAASAVATLCLVAPAQADGLPIAMGDAGPITFDTSAPVLNMNAGTIAADHLDVRAQNADPSGGLAGMSGGAGVVNGTVDFGALNVAVAQTANDFLVIGDGQNGHFLFNLSSATLTGMADDEVDFTFKGIMREVEDDNLHTMHQLPAYADLTLTYTRDENDGWTALLYAHSTGEAPTAVPEPASWALMLGGFGLVGGTLRASRRKTAITFA